MNRVWVCKGRQVVKQSVRKCVVCRKYEGTAYPVLVTVELPSFIMEQAPLSAKVCIDLTSPLYMKMSGTQMKEVYIASFSCAVTRATHWTSVKT